MLCLVTLVNSVVLQVDLDQKAKGQECLDKVCEMLGILEVDYFGLQHCTSTSERRWLNMRNQIRRQIPSTLPYRLFFRVKFYVPPHILLQDVTRYHCYLEVKRDIQDGKYHLTSELRARLLSLMSAAEECPRAEQVRYKLLQEVVALEEFGEEVFEAKGPQGEDLVLGIGPRGIHIKGVNDQKIMYASIDMATHATRYLYLTHYNDRGALLQLSFKLESCQAASSAYRAITEKHAFYSCETVRNAITSQCIRDLKGTLASLLRINTALGKDYVFDVRKTCREVYDHTRRILYVKELEHKNEGVEDGKDGDDQPCYASECEVIKSKLSTFQNALLCKICYDCDIETVFFPCRHVVCCSNCAPMCDKCPLCRQQVSESQAIYLPLPSTFS